MYKEEDSMKPEEGVSTVGVKVIQNGKYRYSN